MVNNLKDIDADILKERLQSINKDYKDLIDKIVPLLQKATLIEKEIELLLTELQSR